MSLASMRRRMGLRSLISLRRSSVAIAVAFAIGACTKKAPPVVESDAGGLHSKRPSTTSWSIAGPNLDGQIDGRLARDFAKPKEAHALVELLLARGQFVSRIADYERADDIAKRVAQDNPKS